MGAFFLYRNDSPPPLQEVGDLFSRKGFSQPAVYRYGNWELWLYEKMLVPVSNALTQDDGMAVMSCGTVVYRGLGYRDSMSHLLNDFRSGHLDQNELLGSFCLIFWNGRALSVLLDRSRTFHVFDNEARTCLSSSFLAVLTASPVRLPINKMALCEKLATGYIVGPDTLIEGIRQVDGAIGATYRQTENGLHFMPVLNRPDFVLHHNGISDSIERQVSALQQHFLAMNALHMESQSELGMSSGYDSRLVLSCSRYLSNPMDLHTHGTHGIHDAEAAIVKRIATNRSLKLKQVLTRKMEDHNAEDIASILDDGLLFYDGRCSHNMGAFSEVYTRAYKSRVMQSNRLGWNGLGGEMYRNYYFTANSSVNLRAWMDCNVYYPFAPEAVANPDLYEAMHRRKMKKLEYRLGTPPSSRIDFLWLRRYYSEVRMPDCDAVNNDANNQLSFFHTPFMDSVLVSEAMSATPYIGCNGNYQAGLIRRIDPGLAAFPTHYGHSLDKIPLRVNLHSWVKCHMPESALLARRRGIGNRNAKISIPLFHAFMARVPVLGLIRDCLGTFLMKGGFDTAMIYYAQRPTTLFVGSFLRAFQHKIKVTNQ